MQLFHTANFIRLWASPSGTNLKTTFREKFVADERIFEEEVQVFKLLIDTLFGHVSREA